MIWKLKKETKSFAAVAEQGDIIGYLEERISNWSKFKRNIALLLSYNCYCYYSAKTLQRGHCSIIKWEFSKSSSKILKLAKILKLDPLVDQDGILKVGGRISKFR